MAEKPILCAGPVVRAILEGRQTQDRRPIKALAPLPDGRPSYPQYDRREVVTADDTYPKAVRGCAVLHAHNNEGAGWYERAPWSPGDVLYVRETWADAFGEIVYRADFDTAARVVMDDVGAWEPSIHMRKKHARIRLRVLSVGVERVNAISEEDARAEGCATVTEFAALWDGLYGVGSMGRGDWCWVTRFEVIRG